MPLVEVIDETPAAEEEEEAASALLLQTTGNEKVGTILAHLVTHYAQPIHIPPAADVANNRPFWYHDKNDCNNQQLPPIVKYCLERLLSIAKEQEQKTTSRLDLLLLALYPHQIRPALFLFNDAESTADGMHNNNAPTTTTTTRKGAPTGHVQSTGVAVLHHYDMLLSQLCSVDSNGCTNEESNSDDEALFSVLSKAMRYMARDIVHVLRLLSRVPEEDEPDDDDSGSKFKQQQPQRPQQSPNHASHVLLHRWVLPSLLRCLDKVFRISIKNTALDNNSTSSLIRQCVVLFLGLSGRRDDNSFQIMSSPLRQVLSRLPIPPPPLPALPEKDEPSTNTTVPLQGMDWNAVQLFDEEISDNQNSIMDYQCTSVSAADFWKRTALTATRKEDGSDNMESENSHDSLTDAQRSTLRQGVFGIPEMAMTVRQFFFGKEDWGLDEDEDENSNQPALANRTRLHLGVTVVDKPVEYEKPYREIPCRMQAAVVFMRLLEADDIVSSQSMLQDLAPILYELLSATQERIQAIGAACLYHLLTITTPRCNSSCNNNESRRTGSLWPAMLLENLATALDLSIKTCRQGPILAVLGMAQSSLLEKMETTFPAIQPGLSVAKGRQFPEHYTSSAQEIRRKATQQWLMIVHKNIHKRDLVWGCLIGGVLPLLKAHAGIGNNNNNVPPNDAIELGRLSLSCLLPLIRQDDTSLLDGGDSSRNSHDHEIQLLALVALQYLLVAAYPVIVQHEGKLLGSLLLCLGRHDRSIGNHDEESTLPVHDNNTTTTVRLAMQVAAMVVVSCSHYRWQQQHLQHHEPTLDDEPNRGQSDNSNSSVISSSKLQQIIDSGSVYEEHLVERAREILREAQSLLKVVVGVSSANTNTGSCTEA